jgi:hypothetical protein
MNSTAQLKPPPAPSWASQPSERRAFRDMLAELVALVGFVLPYGPPVVLLLGPWLILALVVAGPLAWLFALVAVIVIAAMVLAALAAVLLAAPYLVVRRLRRRRARHASVSVPAAPDVAIESPRVVA